jgi:hypothetical protein
MILNIPKMIMVLTTLLLSSIFLSICLAGETIVFLRHGEKPEKGLGQLSCQGLNRALAIPDVLLDKFGAPEAIFAPNPSIRKQDHGIDYDYIRPLATIEPTAIRVGLPVNVQFSFDDIDGIKNEITSEKYKNQVVFVAWEHNMLNEIVKNILIDFNGDVSKISEWKYDDYDSLYVIKINSQNKEFSFSVDKEGLNGQNKDCISIKVIN